jgi:hypothetical protein
MTSSGPRQEGWVVPRCPPVVPTQWDNLREHNLLYTHYLYLLYLLCPVCPVVERTSLRVRARACLECTCTLYRATSMPTRTRARVRTHAGLLFWASGQRDKRRKHFALSQVTTIPLWDKCPPYSGTTLESTRPPNLRWPGVPVPPAATPTTVVCRPAPAAAPSPHRRRPTSRPPGARPGLGCGTRSRSATTD